MEILENIKGDKIFRDLFEHSTVGMSVTTLDGRLHANQAYCEMIGYSKEEIMDHAWADFTHPDDIAYNNMVIANILANGKKSDRWEKRYIHKNGSIIWVDIHTLLHRDDNGKPLHFITTVNDITSRKNAEDEIRLKKEKLELSNAEKDKFFAILAHDLRSPLSSFLGLAEVMAEDLNTMTMSEIEEISKSLYLSATNLYQLLENLLEWSILRRGTTEYLPEETSLNRIVDRSIEPVLESARRKNITLNLELDQAYTVNCDLRMTETVFRNLISNALKYTYANGKVEISARPVSNGEIEISVKDTGIGMSKDLISRLFIVNEQVSRKGTDGESSSGLGLLICKEFVELQGGRIWAESEEGNGTTFYFTLKLLN